MVSLKPVTDAIREVKTGVDKTAAELAIARLRDDIRDLQQKKDALLARKPKTGRAIGAWMQVAMLILLLCGGLALMNSRSATAVMLVGGVFVLFLAVLVGIVQASRAQKVSDGVGALDQQIAAKQAEMQRHSSIVNSR
jgi:hypothetical protein